METTGREAIVIDMQTGTSLMEKRADVPMPPASMSKLMTLYILFESLSKGSLKLKDTMPVSERAWKLGGFKSGSSTMGLDPDSHVTIEDLIRGIVVQSGNDSCIVVAEALAGSEDLFAERMTLTGQRMGLQNSLFKNSTGWPHPEHKMSARDLVLLARRIITDFPQYYHYFKERNFTYNNIKQINRNPLIYVDPSVDGLKTGYTKEAGYGLTASAVRGGRRLLLVINGLMTKKSRRKEPQRLFDWGFREFDNYKLFNALDIVEHADVWLGTRNKVPLVIQNDLTLTLRKKSRPNMKVLIAYSNPIAAPIRKGDKLAVLKVLVSGKEVKKIDLISGENIGRLGFLGRIGAAITSVIWGHPG